MGDVQRAITSGIGGENIAENIEGRERYPISVRYAVDFRDDIQWARQLGPGGDLHDQPDPAGHLGLSARRRAGGSRANCSCNRTAESAVVM
jgi:hypothetical protein